MARVSKAGAVFFERGSWYHRTRTYAEDGNVKYGKKGGFKTPEEAQKSNDLYLTEFLKQQSLAQGEPDKELLFRDYFVDWFERKDLSVKRKNIYSYAYRKILPLLNNIPLYLVSGDYLDTIIRQVTQKTPSYGKKAKELFSQSFANALEKGYLKKSPISDMKECCSKEKKEFVILSEEQICSCLEASGNTNWLLEIMLGVYCGLKKGEIYGLKFSDFDFEKSTVSIYRQVSDDSGQKKGVPTEKSLNTESSQRNLPVPKGVLDEVKKRQERIATYKYWIEDYVDHGYICCQKDGSCKSLESFNIALKKICEKKELPILTVQGLRDLYVVIMIKGQKISYEKLAGLLGYAKASEVYIHYGELIENSTEIASYINDQFTVLYRSI